MIHYSMRQLSHGGKVAQANTVPDYYIGQVFLPVSMSPWLCIPSIRLVIVPKTPYLIPHS